MNKIFLNWKRTQKYQKNLFKYIRFNLFVKTQSTPNPHFLKFLPGREILEEGETFDFADLKQAMTSPLARKLFDVRTVDS